MSGVFAELGLLVAAWVTFAVGTSLAVALAWRAAAPRLRALPPAFRSNLTWATAAAPTLVPTLLLAACVAPGLVGLLTGTSDHCLHHADHPHLCLVHLTATLRGPLVAALMLGGAALGIAVLRTGWRVARHRERLAALTAASHRATDPDRHVVRSARPFSFAAGLFRPEIWVASSLEEALSPGQLAAVLAHERAHLERRDPLRSTLAVALSWPLWPGTRREILAELELAGEQACDEAAGRRLGDRLRVAETILAVERLLGAPPSPADTAVSAFGGSNVDARVRSLLAEPGRGGLPRALSWAALALAALALPLGADALHHGTEHWIRLLLGLA